jgi:hypothetical protein
MVPIDIPTIASEFGADGDSVFGRLYFTSFRHSACELSHFLWDTCRAPRPAQGRDCGAGFSPGLDVSRGPREAFARFL